MGRFLRIILASTFLAVIVSGCVQLMSGPPQPASEIIAGRDELKKNNVARAKELFNSAIKKDRTNRYTYFYIMDLCLQTAHPELVNEYFRTAESALSKTKAEDRAMFYVAAGSTLESA